MRSVKHQVDIVAKRRFKILESHSLDGLCHEHFMIVSDDGK
jgi:hypothetical protein